MKTINILKGFAIGGVLLLASCNTFLDKIPDQRTEIDNEQKINKLLVSAYSNTIPALLHEYMSDNLIDNGSRFESIYDPAQEAYLFTKVTSAAWDTPTWIWEYNYKAIAAANMAIDAIDELEDEGADLSAQRGEALLCRAYAHFALVNTFCQAYNPQSSSTDLGIPYVYDVEITAINEYERGTVAEVYKKIFDDLEKGLPLIDDNLYQQPKYHFNRRAAYAFAAQFNLYYGNYELAIEYANNSIGEDPTGSFRNLSLFESTSTTPEITQVWVSTDEAANIFLQGLSSYHGRAISGNQRYGMNQAQFADIYANGPWTGDIFYQNYMYRNGAGRIFFQKKSEYFVISDPVEQTGSLYNVAVPYTVERTLVDRAEAYTMLGEYGLAARDLSYFYQSYGAGGTSESAINTFYAAADPRYVKDINPRFDIQPGTQTNFIHACLHARRIATVHEGTRTEDLKRFGVRYSHNVANSADITIEPYDNRLAILIPDLVVSAGMKDNPR